MTQEAVSGDVTATTAIPTEISDESYQKYFESGGEITPEVKEVPSEHVATENKTQTENKPQEKEALKTQIEDKEKLSDEERNYKGMAHAERQKRQELQARVERMEAIYSAQQQRMQQEEQQRNLPKIPAFEENPLENLKLTQAQLNAQFAAQNQYFQQKLQSEQLAQRQQQFINDYGNDVAKYTRESKADMPDAYKYLTTERMKELAASGFNPQESHQILIEEEMSVLTKARMDGVNPAERIYNLAVARGYKNAQVEQGQLSPPLAPEQIQHHAAVEEKLDTIAEGMKASRSLHNAGNKPSTNLTLSQLAAMDDDELSHFVKNDWKKLGKLMR